MMSRLGGTKLAWLLIRKDLMRELRSPHVLPGALLLGVLLAFLLAMQIGLPEEERTLLGGGLLWLAVFFAGTLALEQSFTVERDAGCWQALMLCPVAPRTVFLAKMTVNVASLIVLELVIVPTFWALADMPPITRPALLTLIFLLANVGFASIGTLLSGLTISVDRRGGLLALILLPLLAPVVLGAAEATSMLLAGEVDSAWWRWIQLLSVFAALFTVVGALAFEFVLEE
jgi:heme exporter protein B